MRLAACAGHVHVVAYLKEAGADYNLRDYVCVTNESVLIIHISVSFRVEQRC